MAEDIEWVRVKNKLTKHETTIAKVSVRPDRDEILKNKDATDRLGNPLPAKPYRSKGSPGKAEAASAEPKEND